MAWERGYLVPSAEINHIEKSYFTTEVWLLEINGDYRLLVFYLSSRKPAFKVKWILHCKAVL